MSSTTDVMPGRQPNRLIDATSPYLLQHAYNPVDWHPWGQEALNRAQAEDKPILLSVGYSACHWCHVMAHESFEDPETAALMNRLFVNVKVDREERPDIDAIYMEAVQMLTGRGGWPMTVFLTPDGRPFYGGTYFPATPRYGMPSFRQVLEAIADAWQERRRELLTAGDRMAEVLGRSASLVRGATRLTHDLLARATQHLLQSHDRVEGGFGRAPKFPQPMNLDFLLISYLRAGQPALLDAVVLTLTKMANGGIYDQLGGGFHRYSTDNLWLVPHFEKMLYDNAQLARTYLHAWQLTGQPLFRRVAEETLDYVLREMSSPEGGFHSTQDADSEGEEGRFFLWTLDEVLNLLGPEDGRLVAAYYDITAQGNFAEGGVGANILHVSRDLTVVAGEMGVSAPDLALAVDRGRRVLFEAREGRVHPGRDDKILAEWNGLMLRGFAEAGAILGRPEYISAARRAADFVLERMRQPGESRDSKGGRALRLYRTYKDGRAHVNAYVEDYAALGLGLLALYQVTFEPAWVASALALARTMRAVFHDSKRGGFFQTSSDHEQLVARRKDFVDSAVPSGNSLAAEFFLLLGMYTGEAGYAKQAADTLALMTGGMQEQPAAFGRLLCALDLHLNTGPEIAIIGDPDRADTRALLAEVYDRFSPNSVLALCRPGEEAAAGVVPLLAGRQQIGGRATAYVCREFACSLPVTEPSALAEQLAR